ncbi:6122_t:CDS:2 [Funneliformis mosseae]|uniref:6122_t:CDS:1 n=1 Tax=Funneliformis mosseae TaxID=27381 RepID=A0A9N8WSY5_FUNMO|nr:6122_t:CDS:2 [Funneliformis mosseae]
MSRGYDNYNRHICLIPIPDLSRLKRDVGIYISGGMFALGWWFFIDSVVYSNYLRRNGDDDTVPFHVRNDNVSSIVEDNESELKKATAPLKIIYPFPYCNSRSFGVPSMHINYMGSGSATRGARLCLFVGFAAMAGGLAGSCTVLILKYIVANIEMPYLYFGIALVIQNLFIMISSFMLWIAQSTEEEYNHNFL